MMVATKPMSEGAFEVHKEVVNRVASLRTGNWIRERILGSSDAAPPTHAADPEIEERVLGKSGIRIGRRDIAMPNISRYHLEQEFEGVVLSVDRKGQKFLARIVDETDSDAPDEDVVMMFDEISQDDHALITPGALFSWIVGRTEKNRQVERNSEIRFRRTFRFSDFSIERAKMSAATMYALLTDEV